MRRVLALAALAAAAFVTPASADLCAGPLCAIDGCSGTVNVCGGEECSGVVSVCPFAHPDDCRSSVDVCLDATLTLCITCLPPR